jgi:hypothetical protein
MFKCLVNAIDYRTGKTSYNLELGGREIIDSLGLTFHNASVFVLKINIRAFSKTLAN